MSSDVVSYAGWWGEGDRQLFGWLHCPDTRLVRAGVVLCPTFFAEQYWAHGALRQLADRLARQGIAALRFDYSGTGDSSGTPEEVWDVRTWTVDITSALHELRARGAGSVGVVGVRGSANLLAGATGLGADALVLWDPATSGRAYVRHATLLHKTVITDGSSGSLEGSDEQGAEDPASLGFAFPASFVESVKRLRGAAPTDDAPCLLLTRSGRAPAGVALGPRVEVGVAAGQEEFLEAPLEYAALPDESISTIVEWLGHRFEACRPARFDPRLSPARTDPRQPVVTERVTRLGAVGGKGLFAIVTEPTEREGPTSPARLTCVMFSPGVQWHIGPHRLHVDLARELASSGVRSIRLDFRGIGDSPPGERPVPFPGYAPWIMDDLDEVFGALPDGPVAVLGLCSGAYHALESAARYPVVGAIPINLGSEFANLSVRPDMMSTKRRVAVTLADRPWLRSLMKNRLGMMIAWHLPGPVWWLLDRIGLQPDLTRGLLDARARGAEIVLLLEDIRVRQARSWPALHRKRPPAKVISTYGDHVLWGVPGRTAVRDQSYETLLRWASQTLEDGEPRPPIQAVDPGPDAPSDSSGVAVG